MPELTVDVDMKQVRELLERTQKSIKTGKRRIANEIAKPIISSEIEKNIRQRGRAGHGRRAWEPLSASRQKQRSREGLGPHGPILQGKQREIIREAPDVRVSYRGDIITFSNDGGNKRKKFRSHHYGVPASAKDAFGRGPGNEGRTITRSHRLKTGGRSKPYQWRLPDRGFFFITMGAWKEMQKRAFRFLFKIN